ncbi:MAG: hypothetical protein HYV07_18815 [Deltaproteobacteria bacterium]|nr:hypothetical protein [Deltaproteobacteria bacterium]
MKKLALMPLVLLLTPACADQCKEEAPALLFELAAPSALASKIKSARVTLDVGGDTRSKVFNLEREIADGTTSLRIELDDGLTAIADVDATIDAFSESDGRGSVVATASRNADATPDACNVLPFDLAAPSAPDGGVDGGPSDTGADAGVDLGVDTGPVDARLDAFVPDAFEPDDTGIEDAVPIDARVDGGVPDALADAGDAADIAATCNDGVATGAEVCDGTDLRGASCFELGMAEGTPSCNSTCTALETSECSNTINSSSDLASAISRAASTPGHETIAIPAGQIELSDTIEIDECLAGCPNGPQGMTLKPLAGAVTIEGTIEVRSGRVTIEGLRFTDDSRPIRLRNTHTVNSGNNVVRFNRLISSSDRIEVGIDVESDDNQIIGNWIENSATEATVAGIRIAAVHRTVVAMNVIRGRMNAGIQAQGVPGSAGLAETTRIDHNSVELTVGGKALRLIDSANLCVRANVLKGTETSTAVELSSVVLGTECPGAPSGNNDVFGHSKICMGNGCASCAGAGPLCALSVDPGYGSNGDFCLRPAGNPLVNRAVDLGYDLDDSGAGLFRDAAPDVGARELGTARRYGGTLSSCP